METLKLNEIRSNLRESASDLSKWKLTQSAKWSAEALNALCPCDDDEEEELEDNNLQSKINNVLRVGSSKNSTGLEDNDDEEEKEEASLLMMNLSKVRAKNTISLKDQDTYLYAQALFDSKEFDRCAHALRHCSNPCMKFLYLYAKYLSWDMKSQENLESELLENGKSNASHTEDDFNTDALNKAATRNYYTFTETDDDENKVYRSQEQCSTSSGNDGIKISIPSILKELNAYLDSFHDELIDAHPLGFALLYYLKGILTKLQDSNPVALQSFLSSVKLYPYNWGVWLEILDCITRADEVSVIMDHLIEMMGLEHVVIQFFKIVVFQNFFGNNTGEYGLNQQFFNTLDDLLRIFPTFAFLKTQQALISYELKDYSVSEKLFDEIINKDPHRLEDLDTYSNILYVTQNFSKLAHLAQMSTNTDRFRPETCCIVANYYSSKQNHEKAVMYFRRAITLDKNSTNAWTLMGHEFIELKNTHAAIESYRRAVEINPKDYKAWYGLGQAYEIMEMPLYSIYYFQKSCGLHPLDKRIWDALGNCYENLKKKEKIPDAIKCFKRALELSGVEEFSSFGKVHSLSAYELLYRIALLYEKLDRLEDCKKFMMQSCGPLRDESQNDSVATTEDMDKAKLWLAQYEFSERNYHEALFFASRVTSGSAKDVEEARFIAIQCMNKLESKQI